MSDDERFYVRESTASNERGWGNTVWYIRDRLYNCQDVATFRRDGSKSIAVTRGRVNGECVRLNREYQEWVNSSS